MSFPFGRDQCKKGATHVHIAVDVSRDNPSSLAHTLLIGKALGMQFAHIRESVCGSKSQVSTNKKQRHRRCLEGGRDGKAMGPVQGL